MKERHILAIKALAIIGVVLHHLANRRLDADARDVVVTLANLFSWCVLCFLAVSGWLYGLGEQKRQRGVWEYIAIKARRLLLPFVVLVVVYSLIWQAIQGTGTLALRGAIPSGFFAKIAASVWPAGSNVVAEQLYFLPMLFLISVLAHLVHRTAGTRGTAIAASLLLALGLLQFPESANVGFLPGVFVWGGFSYLAGLLMFSLGENSKLRLRLLAGVSVVVLAVAGTSAIAKVLPLLLIALVERLPSAGGPLLQRLGEASGTIYAYHTPFLIQPLLILVAMLSDWRLQLIAVLAAGAAAVAVCMLLYFSLLHTRFKVLLM